VQTRTAKQGEAYGEKDQSGKEGEWLPAPIPFRSPIGAGLQWAVARLFPFNKKDEASPSSVVGVAG
jgi:hypothetical protein